ncbi:MAG TPA: ABC transporter permease [Blastocatellia bacterium]|nr:ABC transporter permease [Blastocatellia bacterium]
MKDQFIQFWRKVLFYLRRDRFDRELEEEMRFHLDMKTEQNIKDGMGDAQARNAALREFGNPLLAKEESRSMRGWLSIEQLAQDLRFGLRMLGKHPVFTLVAVITLALGIGANTAIFSVVNAVLLRPLPYESADRLVWIWDSNPSIGLPRFHSSGPNFKDWRQQSGSFDYIAAFTGWSFNLTGEGEPERIQGALASPDLFSMLAVKPVIGRTFSPEEEEAGSHRVALIGYSFWQKRFGADPAIINRSLTLNGESYTVIGITPDDFRIPYQVDIWTPLALDVLGSGRGSHFLSVIARLKPGVSIEQAQAEMNGITIGLQEQYPDLNTGWGAELQPLHERIVGEVKPLLWILLGAVGFVLLIACANVANLLMARSAARQKEVAIRVALGAGRLRLIRQFLTESLLLALVGGGLGLMLAVWGADLLVALNPRDIPRAEEIGIDGRVLAFTLLVSLITGVVFGLVPALQGSKVDLSSSLKEGSRGLSSSPHHNRAQRLMVVSEIALAIVLLVGAGLMIKSLLRLTEVSLGFDPENVLTMHISLPQSKYGKKDQRAAFSHELLQRVGRLPGVQAAGTISPLPLTGGSTQEIFIEGGPSAAPNQGFNTNLHMCSPDYFRTMRIPLLKGRFFDERDVAQSQSVVIVNETFARRFWPDEDAVGKRISFSRPEGPWSIIIGVVGDTRHLRLDAEAGLEMYRSYSQSAIPYLALVVRSGLDSSMVADSIKSEVLGLDSTLPVYSIRPMQQIISRSAAPRRFQMILLSSFAAIALILSAIGIYGVVSYSVVQRTHEIGVRMALGAQSLDVLKLVIGQGMRVVFVGVVAGLIAAFALTRLIESLLFGVSPADTATFILIALLLMGVALLACYLPARRATKVDQMIALRSE